MNIRLKIDTHLCHTTESLLFHFPKIWISFTVTATVIFVICRAGLKISNISPRLELRELDFVRHLIYICHQRNIKSETETFIKYWLKRLARRKGTLSWMEGTAPNILLGRHLEGGGECLEILDVKNDHELCINNLSLRYTYTGTTAEHNIFFFSLWMWLNGHRIFPRIQ